MPPRRKKDKKKRGDMTQSPESSPLLPPAPSVDDSLNLIGDAHGTSGDGCGSKSPNKTKDDAKISSSKFSNLSIHGVASAAGNTSEMCGLLDSGVKTDSSQSRRILSAKGAAHRDAFQSRNRSPNSPQPSPSKKSKQAECPNLVKIAAQKRDEALARKSSSDSRPSSCNESPVIPRKKTDDPQSSSSTDPSLSENLKASAPGTTLLTVPAPASPRRSPSSSPKKYSPESAISKLQKKMKGMLSPSHSSDSDKSEHDSASPTRIKRKTGTKTKQRAESPKKDQIKSGESSSSSSPGISKRSKNIDEGNISSKSSKTSSLAEPTAVESSSSNNGNRSMECSSDNKSPKRSQNTASGNEMNYDPQEGTSRTPDKIGRNRRFFDQLVKKLFAPIGRYLAEETGRNRSRSATREDVRNGSPHRPALRPCDCGRGDRGFDHRIGCARMIDVRKRRNRKSL